jgi:bifunctional non-homologous end joining protein LigD
MARRDSVGIRLITRRGNDWSDRFPLVMEAVNHLRVRSCLIDGELVCCDERGFAQFDVLRRRRNEVDAFLYAFDLLELDGTDLRREPIEVRKATLVSILRSSRPGVRLNGHLAHDCGLTVFQHACKMGLEGIVSKRLGSRYRSGRSPDWLKFKNPDAPAGGSSRGGGGLGEGPAVTVEVVAPSNTTEAARCRATRNSARALVSRPSGSFSRTSVRICSASARHLSSAPAAPFCSFAMISFRFNGGLPDYSEGEPDEEFWKNFGHPEQNTQSRIAFLCRERRLLGQEDRRR